jgi:hypothetical protein
MAVPPARADVRILASPGGEVGTYLRTVLHIAAIRSTITLPGNVIELDEPMGWEPLTHACGRFKNETVSLMPEPVLS